MSGLCGWIAAHGLPDPAATLAAMQAALPRFQSRHQAGRAGALAALGLASGEVGNWHATPDGLLCAIDGTPVWRDAGLRALARTFGNGRALAEAWRRSGPACPERLDGDFALAVVDAKAREAFAAIDRAGIRTLAWRDSGEGLLFGSTIGSLLPHPDADDAISPQAVFEFLHLSVLPAPGSIHPGIRKLQPAQFVHWRQGSLRTGFYWRMPYSGTGRRDLEALAAGLKDRLRAAVRRTIGDVPAERTGAFLSGGLDSSTVVGLATELQGRPVRSFTIGFGAEDFDETRYAALAARHFGSRHHVLTATARDTADALPAIAASYDEPFGNSSCVPAFLCARLAREQGMEVMLAGDGGDELFGGNERYVLQRRFELYSRIPAPMRRLLEAALLSTGPAGDGIGLVRKARGYVRRARIPMPERLETYNFLGAARYGEVFEPDFLATIDTQGPMESLRAIYDRCAAPSLLQRMLHFDLQVTLADNDLRKVRGMAELAGIEARFPFLDTELVTFSAGIDPSLLIRGFRLRHFYKEAMRDFLPPETIAKTKHGFGLPFRVWMAERGPLRDLTMDALASFRGRGFIRPGFIDALLARWDPDQARMYWQFTWYMLVLELWLTTRRRSGRPEPARPPALDEVSPY